MTRTEHLLIILAEECAEVGQRVTKALRFGLDEKEPGQDVSNEHRICEELADLFTMVDMLEDYGILTKLGGFSFYYDKTRGKREKVARYLEYSKECGTLDGEP